MLGKTAGGIFWLFRYLERSENTARLVDAGFRIALTRSASADREWESVIATAGARAGYRDRHAVFEASAVIDYLLRDRSNPSSVLSVIGTARDNARMVRTALTREVWEAVNECWLTLSDALSRPVRERDLPAALATIRQQSALVRGALHGTMLRNEVFNFARLGTFVERADNTARILDVKYYVLLPSLSLVGSSLDNVQWETILRSVSAHQSFRWVTRGEPTPRAIAHFMILDRRLPRSLAFCCAKISGNLGYLESDYGHRPPSHTMADACFHNVRNRPIDDIFDQGLHEFLIGFIADNQALGVQIERDYRFYE